jgi:hypothetical protein
MNKAGFLCGVAALALVGCSTHHHRHTVYREYPDSDRTVVIDRDGTRTYVREYEAPTRYESRHDYGVQPRYRGKHADALGWNDPYWYYGNRY